MKASEFLAQARDELAAGWTRHTLEDQSGNVCSVGALARTAALQQPQTFDEYTEVCAAEQRATKALLMVVEELTGHPSITGFNDGREDREEVLMAFEKAQIQREEVGD